MLRVKHLTEEVVGYEMMIRAEPSTVSLHNDVALIYAELGKTDKAAAHFEMAVKLQPDSASAHFNLGTALSSMGKVADAIEQFREALRLQPDYGAAHNNLGQALLASGNLDQAQHHFREAARLDPDSAGPHYNLGVIARGRGDMPEAIDRFRQAVRLQPDWVQAVGNLAWLLATAASASLGDANEAIRLAEHAAALTNRQNAGVLDILAAAHAAAGRFDLAAITCEAALRLQPDARLAAAIRQRLALYKQGRRYISWGGAPVNELGSRTRDADLAARRTRSASTTPRCLSRQPRCRPHLDVGFAARGDHACTAVVVGGGVGRGLRRRGACDHRRRVPSLLCTATRGARIAAASLAC